jgi:hypothetical protein
VGNEKCESGQALTTHFRNAAKEARRKFFAWWAADLRAVFDDSKRRFPGGKEEIIEKRCSV